MISKYELVVIFSLFIIFENCECQYEVILSAFDVYALKTRATYSCSTLYSTAANWYLNGTISTDLQLVNTTEFFFNNTNVGIFVFKYLTGVYNNTRIECEALFPSSSPRRSTYYKTLVIQGYLAPVLHLNYTLARDNVTITWDAPFSLDIPRIDPDVEYCVTINSSGEILHSECEIWDTEFHFRFNGSFPHCEENTAIVTPYNDVVGNGSSSLLYLDSEEVILSAFDVFALTTQATYSCCAHRSSIGANWYLNGTLSTNLQLVNTTEVFFQNTNTGIFVFDQLTGVYNNTRIQCEAFFPSSPPRRSRDNKTLVIQGYLAPVLHLDYALNGDNLTIMWEAPFSLDIPQIDPDVKYCVTIKSSGEILHSECEIRDTEFYFRFDGSFPYCEENSAIVTPYNDVVGNGSSNLVYLESEEDISCSEIISAESTSDDVTIYLGFFNKSVVMVVTIAGVFTVLIATLIAAVIVITICMAKLKKRKNKSFCIKEFEVPDSKKSNLQDDQNGRYYDSISDSTDKHIYEEVKGKLNKPAPAWDMETCAAYECTRRNHATDQSSCTSVPPRTDQSEISETAVKVDDACPQYETLDAVLDKIIEKIGTNASDIDMKECSAYGSNATIED